jgi:hypothetical protein
MKETWQNNLLTLQKRKGILVSTLTKKQFAELVRSAKTERKQLLEQVKFLDDIISLSGEEVTVRAKPQLSKAKSTKKKYAWSASAKRRFKEKCNTPEAKQKYSQAQRARRARERLNQSKS